MEKDNPHVMTESEMETQIRRDMASIRRKNLPPEKLETEYRKYDNMYHLCVLDGGNTAGVYMWREVYRRLLDEDRTD